MTETVQGGGKMLLVSGPSGTGKSTICKLLGEDPRVVFSVSATTRKPRAGEVDGRDYHFVSKARFTEMIQEGEFIEHADVYGNMYGTLRAPMEAAIEKGQIFLVEIDIQGALQLKTLEMPGLYMFIAPPDFETLTRRLSGRGTESPELLKRRLHKAADEMEERFKYDHVIVNDVLETAVEEIRVISGLGQGATP